MSDEIWCKNSIKTAWMKQVENKKNSLLIVW